MAEPSSSSTGHHQRVTGARDDAAAGDADGRRTDRSDRPDRSDRTERSDHPERSGPSGSRRELARKRTRRSYRRTLLAKERTFAAWVRTGLASMAVGFGAAQLLTDLEPRWLVLSASSALVGLGMLAVAFGYWSFRSTLQELAEEEDVRPGVPAWVVGVFSAILVAAGVAGLVLILR